MAGQTANDCSSIKEGWAIYNGPTGTSSAIACAAAAPGFFGSRSNHRADRLDDGGAQARQEEEPSMEGGGVHDDADGLPARLPQELGDLRCVFVWTAFMCCVFVVAC